MSVFERLSADAYHVKSKAAKMRADRASRKAKSKARAQAKANARPAAMEPMGFGARAKHLGERGLHHAGRLSGVSDLREAHRMARSGSAEADAIRKLRLQGAGKLALTTAGLGALGYGATRMMDKKSSYDPMVAAVEELDGWEFAKEAELRAAEILLADGVDPDTFEYTQPEHVKLASFPDPEDAYTYEGEEELALYNDMLDEAALDIIEELGLI